jgi:hypothetical protein
MRPTIEEQLRGVGRLVDELAADPDLRPESAALARDAGKQLKRLTGSVAARPLFLRWDNVAMTALVRDLAPMFPAELQRLITESCEGTQPVTDDDAQNEVLRALVTAAIEVLPDDEVGDRARRSIADHLRVRAAANPALHKHPERPWAVAPLAAEYETPMTEKATT